MLKELSEFKSSFVHFIALSVALWLSLSQALGLLGQSCVQRFCPMTSSAQRIGNAITGSS